MHPAESRISTCSHQIRKPNSGQTMWQKLRPKFANVLVTRCGRPYASLAPTFISARRSREAVSELAARRRSLAYQKISPKQCSDPEKSGRLRREASKTIFYSKNRKSEGRDSNHNRNHIHTLLLAAPRFPIHNLYCCPPVKSLNFQKT